jgi:hypothetical protein
MVYWLIIYLNRVLIIHVKPQEQIMMVYNILNINLFCLMEYIALIFMLVIHMRYLNLHS